MIVVAGRDGLAPAGAVAERLAEIVGRAARSSKRIRQALSAEVKRHFKARWPGSRHFSPDKVKDGDARDGARAEATVEIDAPGITRAYRDLTIKPRFRRFLAIPFKGVRGAPGDYLGAFPVRTKDGKAFLARNAGGRMEFLFSLVRKAFQRRDESMMPSDQRLFYAAANAAEKAMEAGETRRGN